MTRAKVDEILEEYKDGRLESTTPMPDALYKKGSIGMVWSAIDMAFQAIKSINRRLKILEGKGNIDTSDADEEI